MIFIFAFGFNFLTRGWGGYVEVLGIVELDLIVCRDIFVANFIFVLSRDFVTSTGSILSFFYLLHFFVLTSLVQEKILSESAFECGRESTLSASSARLGKTLSSVKFRISRIFSPHQVFSNFGHIYLFGVTKRIWQLAPLGVNFCEFWHETWKSVHYNT